MADNSEIHSKMETPGKAPGNGEPGFLYRLPGVMLAVAGYSLIHIVARLLASGNLGDDDPLDNLLVQFLSPGYSPDQPPLYDWVLWGLQHVFGSGIHSFLVLKYSLLVFIGGFLFVLTRRLTGSGLWGFLSVEAMALVYQIFWRLHEGFTHRVGAMTLAIATCWGVVRLLDRGQRRDYFLFGVLVGLGLLTEHSYAVLLLALVGGASLQPAARRQILSLRTLLSVVVALLIVSPYAVWLIAEPQRLTSFWQSLLPFSAEYTFAGLLNAVSDALTFPLLVLAPYIFILPLMFPGVLREIIHSPLRPLQQATPDLRQLLLHTLLIELALLVLFDGLVFQRGDYPVHSLLPMMVIALVWLTAKACDSLPSPGRIRWYVMLTLAAAVIALVGRAANMYIHEPVCSKCRWGTPYAELADSIRAAGFKQGMILTPEVRLAGDLRRFFPQSRFMVPGIGLEALADPAAPASSVVIVWDARADSQEVLSRLEPLLGKTLRSDGLQPVLVDIPWPHLWKPTGYRHTSWRYLIMSQ